MQGEERRKAAAEAGNKPQTAGATVTLDQQTLRWVAEDKELEYELG